MTTPARQAANARNAQRSTGPKTPEGKARSSRNALKHGLTSRDVVLPNGDPAAFQARLDQWNDYYRPDDPAQAAVIERAVSSKWKLDRITRLETERLSEQVRHATDRYDLDAFSAAEALGQRLLFEPMDRTQPPQTHDPIFQARLAQRTADNPAILARQMQMTAQGAQWLIDRWVDLGEMLKLHGFWHYPEKLRALWMLGKHPEDVLEDRLVQRIMLACNVAHPDTDEDDPDRFRFWDECYQNKMGLQGRPMYFFQTDVVKLFKPADHLTAQAWLWEIIGNEVNRLRALKSTHLDPIDAADRAAAGERAMFDGSKEGVLLRRYETACEREFHRSISDLMKLRKAPAPEPAEAADEPPVRTEPIAEPSSEPEVTAAAPAAAPADLSSPAVALPFDDLRAPVAPLAGSETPPTPAH